MNVQAIKKILRTTPNRILCVRLNTGQFYTGVISFLDDETLKITKDALRFMVLRVEDIIALSPDTSGNVEGSK